MSIAAASIEHAPSKPEVTPYNLALMAQKAIKDCQIRAETEAALIRQLLVHRHVRVKGTTAVYLVRELRMTIGWRAILYGSRKGHRNKLAIGTIDQIEVVDTEEST